LPVYRLSDSIAFPPPREADESGLLAVGGDLRPERLIQAYSSGIFPWPHEGYPLLWFSPDPRMVLEPERLPERKRLERSIRSRRFRFTLDQAFRQVMEQCAATPSRAREGTWINGPMIEAYCTLHLTGHAHSIECWQGDRLVGGLYGVVIRSIFIGESMFSDVTDASKACFYRLVQQLARWGFTLMDGQVETEHLAFLGMEPWDRRLYLKSLRRALESGFHHENWELDPDLTGG